MLVSHEVPLNLLKRSLSFNDYDFILNHLLNKYPKYKRFFMKHNKRYQLLDSSAYENYVNGEEFDIDNFMRNIEELKPNEILIPDFFMDKNKTIENFDNFFLHQYNHENTYAGFCRKNRVDTFTAVVQGKTFDEFYECLMYYSKNRNFIDKLAISFHYPFLEEMGLNDFSDNKDFSYALGRARLLKKLDTLDLLFKPLHLLGSHYVGEFAWYKDKYNIHTIDTGLPIKNGICSSILVPGTEQTKADIIIDEFFDKKIPWVDKEIILSNVALFKEMIS